jgi:hypothetical protein
VARWQQIYPEGFYDILVRLKNEYAASVPITITENGIPTPDVMGADGKVDDPQRILTIANGLILFCVPVANFRIAMQRKFRELVGVTASAATSPGKSRGMVRVASPGGAWLASAQGAARSGAFAGAARGWAATRSSRHGRETAWTFPKTAVRPGGAT